MAALLLLASCGEPLLASCGEPLLTTGVDLAYGEYEREIRHSWAEHVQVVLLQAECADELWASQDWARIEALSRSEDADGDGVRDLITYGPRTHVRVDGWPPAAEVLATVAAIDLPADVRADVVVARCRDAVETPPDDALVAYFGSLVLALPEPWAADIDGWGCTFTTDVSRCVGAERPSRWCAPREPLRNEAGSYDCVVVERPREGTSCAEAPERVDLGDGRCLVDVPWEAGPSELTLSSCPFGVAIPAPVIPLAGSTWTTRCRTL